MKDLDDLKKQLPKPFIILGDFNAHNLLWGSWSTDTRGKIIEQFLEDQELIILNTGSATHHNSSNSSESAIDLTIVSASVAEKFEWEISDYLYDSDHYPVKISDTQTSYDQATNNIQPNKIRNLKKANWPKYKEEIIQSIQKLPNPEGASDIDDLIDKFNDAILCAADIAIPWIKIKKHKKKLPWWNAECEEALKNSKHAFNRKKNIKQMKIKLNTIE